MDLHYPSGWLRTRDKIYDSDTGLGIEGQDE